MWRKTISYEAAKSLLAFKQRTGILLFAMLLASCATTPPDAMLEEAEVSWIQSVIDYQATLPADHPDTIEKQFVINDEMREEVQAQFSMLSKHSAVRSVAHWLLGDYGRNMEYDVNANFSPIEAYEKQRGNCLSFTILLVSLAKELGIKVEYNLVDIPDTWTMDEGLGMVFYRHVNGVLKSHGKRQIFDLAMELYDAGYPQEYISETEVFAMLMNNRAIEALERLDIEKAKHMIKLAISVNPESADLWVNLGVIEKRHGSIKNAESAFLYAYGVNKYSIVAISNLERFYRELGLSSKAAKFAKQAERARLSNPYIHYHKALTLYENGEFRKAMHSTKRAIILHDQDPKFFELKSLIAQKQERFKDALLALEQAYILSSKEEQRTKYANKVDLVTRNAISVAERNARLNRGQRIKQEFQLQNSTLLGQ